MNENLDLVKILKDCPKGTKLYLSVIGDQVELQDICSVDVSYPILVKEGNHQTFHITRFGRMFSGYPDGDCVLWPSKECRDWSKFKASVERFDPKTLQPFDKVLVRDNTNCKWYCDFFSHIDDKLRFVTVGSIFKLCIPYNYETKPLVGTTDKPDEKYIWWEE